MKIQKNCFFYKILPNLLKSKSGQNIPSTCTDLNISASLSAFCTSSPHTPLHFLRRFLLHASDSGAHEETPLPLHNADAPSVGRMKLLRHVSEAGCVSLGLMMAWRPAHCPSAYAHSCVCVSLCKCVCVCVHARGWQGSSCWLKATPLPSLLLFLLLLPHPHRAPCEKDSGEHEPLSGRPRWGHKIRVTWIYRPNMTAELWSPVWDASRRPSLGSFLCKWRQVWTEYEWDSSHCPGV